MGTQQVPCDPTRLRRLLDDGLTEAERAEVLTHLDACEACRAPPVPLSAGHLLVLNGHAGPVHSVAVSPDGKRALSGSGWPDGDRSVRLWDLESGRQPARLLGHPEQVLGVAFTPDGKRALSACFDGTVRLWDLEDGTLLRSFEGHSDQATSVAVSPDGRHALSGSFDKSVRLWDLESGKEVRRFYGHTDHVLSVACAADGGHALSGGAGGDARLWDVETGREVRRFRGHSGWVESVALSPDGRRALTGSRDRTARLWDVDGGKVLLRFAHTDSVLGVAFSPDGRRAATACRDKLVRVWDAEDGRELCRLAGHGDAVWSVAFTSDGRRLLSGGGGVMRGGDDQPGTDWSLRLWDLDAAVKARGADPAARPAGGGPPVSLLPEPLPDFPPAAPLNPAAMVTQPAPVEGARSWTIATHAHPSHGIFRGPFPAAAGRLGANSAGTAAPLGRDQKAP